MSSTFRVLFYLRRNYVNKEGKASIMIRITISGEVVQFSSKLDIEPELWSGTAGRAIGRTAAATKINTALDGIKTAIINHYRRISDREPSVTAEKVRNEFLGIVPKGETLLELFDKHIEDTSKLVGISKSAATLQKHKVTRTHVANFMASRYKISDISLKEINHMFLTDFENFLRVEAQCNANTTAKFMQFFKRIIIIARNNGWIHADPFANYIIRLQKVDRGYLTQEEIEAILKRKFESKRLEQVRDIFIFSCFTGLAYIDVKKLTKYNVRTSFDGNLWIMTKRQKTNVQSNILLLEVPQRIIEKYSGTLPDGILLPVLSNQKMNAYLKEIGDLCGIEKNLTFHLARHTFATTITLAKGVPIETVSKMLGHTNIKTTQIYARITDSKIGNDMQALAGKLQSLNETMANTMELQIIQQKIFEVRGCRVMLDFHLAELYGVQTKVLKQAVKRNEKRFPNDFRFTLTADEWKQLVTNCDQIPDSLKHSYILPDCFTEQGVAMLSSVLRSDTAIDVNIAIMRTFVAIRQMIVGYDELLKRVEELEVSTDAQFNELYQALTELLSKPEPVTTPRRRIGYNVNND